MKAHEETWVEDLSGINVGESAFLECGPCPDGKDAHDARLRLACQAPAMARLLLSLEWTTPDVDDPYPGARCPNCEARQPIRSLSCSQDGATFGPKPTRAEESAAHHPKCELLLVLRAAGVLP